MTTMMLYDAVGGGGVGVQQKRRKSQVVGEKEGKEERGRYFSDLLPDCVRSPHTKNKE